MREKTLDKYVVSSRIEETWCQYCGIDLLLGDHVIQVISTTHTFCCFACIQQYDRHKTIRQELQ